MRIGEMAEAVGISEYTLRYYEKEGLLRVRRDDADVQKVYADRY